MRVLVITEKESQAKPFVKALKNKGIMANKLQLIKISLVSKHKNTILKAIDENIPKYDAVFLQCRENLAPFIEPLIETLKDNNVYCNAKPGSFYLAVNEPYKFVNLAVNNIPTPRTLISGAGKNIERISKNVSYPLIAKSFLGKDVQQSIIVNSDKELNNFIGSIKTSVDGFMLREYINDCVISCVVIGEKVFAIDKRNNKMCVAELDKGRYYKPSEKEKKIAINAAKASGLDIAKVDMVKGRVLSVETKIPIDPFNKICSIDLSSHIANFYFDKVNEIGVKKSISDDFREMAEKLQKSFFSRFLK